MKHKLLHFYMISSDYTIKHLPKCLFQKATVHVPGNLEKEKHHKLIC